MIHHGDCLDVMATFDAESIDAIVTDPPYGLEFMGKDWDRLDAGLPQENVWKGRRGNGGSSVGSDDTKPSSRHHVNYGGKHNQFRRCSTCGKRQFSGSPCECAEPVWVLEVAQAAPTSALRMQRWHEQWAREAYRVAKPGAHLLAFGGTRTYHRLAAAIEDAGWEIRDTLVWAYASGFPKSLDVSKAIDKAAGSEREVVGQRFSPDGKPVGARRSGPVAPHSPGGGYRWGDQHYAWDDLPQNARDYFTARHEKHGELTAPATDLAREWQGWGTALKPAWEPIVLARKPLRGTVAGNVTEYGTGALNIDGCRIAADETDRAGWSDTKGSGPKMIGNTYNGGSVYEGDGLPHERPPAGRWPANVILTDPIFDGDTPGVVGGGETAVKGRYLDTETGIRAPSPFFGAISGENHEYRNDNTYANDSGTYSRFFLIPKAARSDREPVLGGLPAGFSPTMGNGIGGREHDPADVKAYRANVHPTVKPTDLMRHLVRLVTPPGGVVLDPFLGSGTTALAAEMEGFEWVGIEREAEYVAIAEARLNGTQRGLGLDVAAPTPRKTESHAATYRSDSENVGYHGLSSRKAGTVVGYPSENKPRKPPKPVAETIDAFREGWPDDGRSF